MCRAAPMCTYFPWPIRSTGIKTIGGYKLVITCCIMDTFSSMQCLMLDGWMNQAYSRISTTHGHITDCKLDSVVYAGVGVVILMWTCLLWAERSTPDNCNFWVPNHRFISATGEQKGITQTIYTDSEPPSRMPNSLMPSAKLRSANLPF